MVIGIVIGFLAASIFLYCLLGGADFGAGVLELFVNKRYRARYEELVMKAMGPVWEANHMWLIIVIVILFNGFPKAYTTLSIYFHIPLTLMLIGVILRGCAFTFRHYDAFKDGSRRYYSLIFSFSSLWTPFMFGVIIGGMMLGKIDPTAKTYHAQYVAPWCNLFSMSVGLFVLCIFTFLSSIFLIGETDDAHLKPYFIKKARITNILTVLAGGFVFVCAAFNGLSLIHLFLSHPVSLVSMMAATISLYGLWKILDKGFVWKARMMAGFQLMMIVGAWFAVIFPNIIFFKDGGHVTLFNTAAPSLTMTILAWALMIGVVIFVPALYYLFAVFKGK